ncbi:hypothetical protein ABZ625_21575 [Streptomyces smyrnaeus]
MTARSRQQSLVHAAADGAQITLPRHRKNDLELPGKLSFDP